MTSELEMLLHHQLVDNSAANKLRAAEEGKEEEERNAPWVYAQKQQ